MIRIAELLLISVVFLVTGCIKVTQMENGRIVSERYYYPLSKQKDIHYWKDVTPLHIAAFKGREEEVKKLIKQGYDPFKKTVNPANNYTYMPIELAALTDHTEITVYLFQEMLRKKHEYLRKNKEDQKSVFGSVLRVAPVMALNGAIQYHFDMLLDPIMKKILSTSKYKGAKGLVQLAEDAARMRAPYALESVRHFNQKYVDLAFDRQANRVQALIGRAFEAQEEFETLKFYKNFVSPNKFKRYEALHQAHIASIKAANKAIRNFFAGAFKGMSSDSTNKYSMKYAGFDDDFKLTNYDLYVDGSYNGRLFFKINDNGSYSIDTVGLKKGSHVNGLYMPDEFKLYTPQCGYKRSVRNLDEALHNVLVCVYEHRYE